MNSPSIFGTCLLLGEWLAIYATAEFSALRNRETHLYGTVLAWEGVTSLLSASIVVLLASGVFHSALGRGMLVAMLVAVSIFPPLLYRFLMTDHSARGIFARQHLIWHGVLWTGVPWALGLVGNQVGVMLTAAAVAIALLLMSLGVGTFGKRYEAALAATLYLAVLAVAAITRFLVLANIATGILALTILLSLRRTRSGTE